MLQPAALMPPGLTSIPIGVVNKIESLPYVVLLDWLNQESLARGLVCGTGRPLHFVPQDHLPTGAAYESWIADTGCVPTRDNFHDRYNAMMWLCSPKTKARLNQLQAEQLSLSGRASVRGAVRDAATLWDENLMVLSCSRDADRLSALLTTADWPSLFLAFRSHWHRDWQPLVFGHALLEKLRHPYKSMTAHCVVVTTSTSDWETVDAQLVKRLTPQLMPRSLHPLPVMGIPGWHPDNVDASFYQDTAVFRPPRRP